MPGSESELRQALDTVEEPELRRTVGELGLVAGVAIDGGTAVVAIADPLPDRGHWSELSRRLQEAGTQVAGVDRVEVDVREMTEDEKPVVARVLKGEAAPDPLAVVDASAAAPGPRPRVNPFTDARTRVLAIASGKGGVGKSSVTANLSIALAERGKRVAVVDADVWASRCRACSGSPSPPA